MTATATVWGWLPEQLHRYRWAGWLLTAGSTAVGYWVAPWGYLVAIFLAVLSMVASGSGWRARYGRIQ